MDRRFFGDFPLAINRQPHHAPTELHSHTFKELVIILSGKGVHFSAKDAYDIIAGDCFVVEEAHGYKNTDGLSLVNILFMPDRLPLPWDEARKLPGYHAFFALEPKYRDLHNFRNRLRFSPTELSRASALIDDLEQELSGKSAGFEILAIALFMELIGFISRTYAHMKGAHHSDLLRLSEVISHLERNYAQDIRLPDLTKLARMSESRLLRSFRGATGHSPIDYLLRLRIRQACGLLRQEDRNITEVAYQVGFNDSNYFSRQFRRIMGISPRQHRQGGRGPRPAPSGRY
jgi:AraC-like DNA-binding protein